MLKHFGFSFFSSTICLALAAWWGYEQGGISMLGQALFITAVLALMEISLSFDNAVVNASVLRGWPDFWLKLFLTVGILIAVFGMRLIFPLAIVAITANMGLIEVAHLALNDPAEYADRLLAHHSQVATFGGIFLMMVFLNFFFDENKDEHWLHWLEKPMQSIASVQGMALFICLILLILAAKFLTAENEVAAILTSGIWGLVTYLGVQVLSGLLERENAGDGTSAIMKGGIAGFIYLEVLDASFSFDGVIGAFAITSDVVIIMLGLAIGAIFVRSITIYLVEKGTLQTYAYLEHGAHYAIGALAVIMLLSIKYHIPELVTGSIGIALILMALFASWRKNRRETP